MHDASSGDIRFKRYYIHELSIVDPELIHMILVVTLPLYLRHGVHDLCCHVSVDPECKELMYMTEVLMTNCPSNCSR